MNRIIRENYPASKLPEDLRTGVDPSATVTVTIVEEEKRPEKVMSLEEIFSLKGFRRRSAAEIDADLRRQRDEWDD
ncbi:hypothetical protein KMZ29_24100 [Bradyrhizobium sediminis]|uniref:Uncharacterized protein n=1 Tax=Bradyrhizobium sediminis TaxID=2840469 RepID=A0A975RMG2_9BRAD|nr:hypothetical protein [Bradyrhizobium sediminis]QWG12734.1 hypothetical protein KMZ29_24100 [Bradyrhizobium sediminis]